MKAGAMLYVIFICFLLATVSSSLIFFSYSKQLMFLDARIEQKLFVNAYSGMELLMSEGYDTLNMTVDLYEWGEDSVKLHKRDWGLLYVCSSEAFMRGRTRRLFAMTGMRKKNMPVLYVAFDNRTVRLSGNFLIAGNAYLPYGKADRRFDIKGAQGDHHIKGKIEDSRNVVNFFKEHSGDVLQRLFEKGIADDSLLMITSTSLPDTLVNSFFKPTIVLYSQDALILDRQQYTGNIRIVSEKEIRIQRGCALNDVIVAAPSVRTFEGFSGSLQLWAIDSLLIADRCSLNYPSIAGIHTTGTSGFLGIGTGTILNGAVLGLGGEMIKMDIREDVVINGVIYNEGKLDFKGRSNGTVWTNNAFYQSAGIMNDNYIADASFENNLPSSFVFPALFSKDFTPGIIKWLE